MNEIFNLKRFECQLKRKLVGRVTQINRKNVGVEKEERDHWRSIIEGTMRGRQRWGNC